MTSSHGSDKSRQQAEEFFKRAVGRKSARFAKLCSGHIFTSRKGDLGDYLLIEVSKGYWGINLSDAGGSWK